MLCLGIVCIFVYLSVMIGSTIWKRDRNEINKSDSRTGAGILDDTPHSIFFGDLGITCVDDILSFSVDLIKLRFFPMMENTCLGLSKMVPLYLE